MKNFLAVCLMLFSLTCDADFWANYPIMGVPVYNTLAGFPSATATGNGQLAIAADTDILYVSTGTVWEVLADPAAAANSITALTGDVTATGPGSVPATVAFVGGSSAASVNTAAVAVAASTALNTVSTLVKRDGSGNFAAGTITAALTGTASGNPPNARSISTTAPLTGGGDLSADRTFAITQATTSTNGYLTSSDWNTFNNKQGSGSYITSLTGGVTASGPGAATATVVTNANLTGVITSVGNATSIASQTGTGTKFVVDTSPTLITPVLGVASGTSLALSGQLTSTLASGTAPFSISSTTLVPNLYVARSALADSVTTNANLTGVITSVGNATSIASQTGTGTKFVVDTSPTLVTPNIGAATGTSLNLSGLTISQAVVTDSSKNLASLGYASANTASNLVQRDASGNFTAGTITASLTGNATGLTSGALTNTMVASNAAIDYGKLATMTSANTLVGSSLNVATVVPITGVIALSNTGATSFASGAFGSTAISTTGTLSSGNATIAGFTDGSAASAGKVGEVLTASLARGSATGLSTSTAKTIATLSLTAGDWDLWAFCSFAPAGSTSVTQSQCAIANLATTAINVLPAVTTRGVQNSTGEITVMNTTSSTVPGDDYTVQSPMSYLSVSSGQTMYLTVQSTFTVSTNAAYGSIVARRRR